MRATHQARERLYELRLPRAERAAVRSERRVLEAMRRERDNDQTAERRAARIEAERHRYDFCGFGAP